MNTRMLRASYALSFGLTTASCCADTVNVVSVSTTSNGVVQPSQIWIGDSVTVVARAYRATEGLCFGVLYDSEGRPSEFTFQSSNSAAATVNAGGVLIGVAPGATGLTATSAGVASMSLPVVVGARLTAIRTTVTPAAAAVGDTIDVRVEAIDAAGNPVADAVVRFWSLQSQDSSVVFISEVPAGKSNTPYTLRFRAAREGTATVGLNAPHDIPSGKRAAASVVLHVGPKSGT